MASSNSGLAAGSLFNVDGLVALVTGGGTGVGLMITKTLALNGAAKIYIAGRRLEVLEKAASSVGTNVIPIQCDVTSKESLKEAYDFIKKDTGYLNLLVCNSGVGGPQVKPLKPETTLEDWSDQHLDIPFDTYVNTFAVNAASVWYTAMTFLRLLDEGNKKGNLQQSSQVVITSSIASFNKKSPGGWAYGQSKAAATMAVKQLSVVLPQWNIRSNGIAPGLFPSEMSEPIVKAYAGESGEPGAIPREMVPMGRMGDEKDMGGTILYLASRGGAYTNGDVLIVDGGRLGNFPSLT